MWASAALLLAMYLMVQQFPFSTGLACAAMTTGTCGMKAAIGIRATSVESVVYRICDTLLYQWRAGAGRCDEPHASALLRSPAARILSDGEIRQRVYNFVICCRLMQVQFQIVNILQVAFR